VTLPVVVHSYTLLHNRLYGLCRQLAQQCGGTGPEAGDIGASALGVIVLADASVEIAIHHRIEKGLPPREIAPPLREVFRITRESLLKRRPPLDRLKELAKILNLTIRWDEEPWLSAGDLHAIRNALAHYESRPVYSTHPETETFPGRTRLLPIAQRIGTADKRGPGVWLELFLNPTCAAWACDTADKVLKELDSSVWNLTLHFS
jgi:hypothetical protein